MTDQLKVPDPVVLTIAGFDPSGGAGIIADIRTSVHFKVRSAAAITSLTLQNSKESFGAIHESARSVRAQVLPIIEEHQIAAVKIGLLPTTEIVLEVARLIAESVVPAPVIDPVMRATSGYELVEPDVMETLVTELMPLARLVTPNISEAEEMTGLKITGEKEMLLAAARLREIGARAALIKGGHLSNQTSAPIDVLDDDGHVTTFDGEWIAGRNLRGTGCMLSSAIAAGLARNNSLEESVRAAKSFVAGAIRQAQD
ncbi:MAG TPA: bifunctional hydroxymethylpyrimidine kinase/phosphomethylpyrimidine kinase [Pyrinomonadaceae bacterium]